MNEKLNTSKTIINKFYAFQGGVGELRGQRSSIFSPLQRLRQLGYRASNLLCKVGLNTLDDFAKIRSFFKCQRNFPRF